AFVVCGAFLVVLTSQGGWKGPRVAYIDIFAYPFYCVFAAHALAAAVASLDLSKLPKVDVARRDLVAGIVLCALPWLVLLDYAPPPLQRPEVRNLNPFIWPPADTPLTR